MKIFVKKKFFAFLGLFLLNLNVFSQNQQNSANSKTLQNAQNSSVQQSFQESENNFSNNPVKKYNLENLETDGEKIKFEFKYQKGDRYRILSTVNEDVFFNRIYDHHAVIVNRVSAEIKDVDEKGNALHEASFMTTEDSTGAISGNHFTYGEEYHSVFTRSKDGTYSIGDEYFMPTVRDVPKFPNRELSAGDTWNAQGHEAHDLRQSFNLEKPYKVPFVANYTYLGRLKENGLYVFTAKYTMEMQSPQVQGNFYAAEVPTEMLGFSNETIFWDAEKGAIDSYTENFRILMYTSYGNVYEFRGEAYAEVSDFERTSTEENLEQVQKKIDDLGLSDVNVKRGEKGLTLSLENIKFKADSPELLESEKQKLNEIAKILEQWPDNDVLVEGHTALAGTARVRQKLSEERAQAVADYLINLGVRDSYHIFTKGYGASKPIADNSTERGKAKNRRVEITIMDK